MTDEHAFLRRDSNEMHLNVRLTLSTQFHSPSSQPHFAPVSSPAMTEPLFPTWVIDDFSWWISNVSKLMVSSKKTQSVNGDHVQEWGVLCYGSFVSSWKHCDQTTDSRQDSPMRRRPKDRRGLEIDRCDFHTSSVFSLFIFHSLNTSLI